MKLLPMPQPTVSVEDIDDPLHEIIFTWDETPWIHHHFLVSRLEKYLIDSNHETVMIPVEAEFAGSLPDTRGLEIHRLESIPEDLTVWSPVISLLMPDGTDLLVDGNHRYFIAWSLGATHIKAWRVEQEIWGRFMLKLPMYLGASNEGWSGL